MVPSETQPPTCHGVDGCDGQQAGHRDVEVPAQGLLDEEGPSVHIDLEKRGGYHGCTDDIPGPPRAGSAGERERLADQAVSFSRTGRFCHARVPPAPHSAVSTRHIPLQPQLLLLSIGARLSSVPGVLLWGTGVPGRGMLGLFRGGGAHNALWKRQLGGVSLSPASWVGEVCWLGDPSTCRTSCLPQHWFAVQRIPPC